MPKRNLMSQLGDRLAFRIRTRIHHADILVRLIYAVPDPLHLFFALNCAECICNLRAKHSGIFRDPKRCQREYETSAHQHPTPHTHHRNSVQYDYKFRPTADRLQKVTLKRKNSLKILTNVDHKDSLSMLNFFMYWTN